MKLHFPNRSGMTFAMLGALALGIGFMAFRAQADQWDKTTVLTVNEPIQVSDTYLDPGTYVFKLVDIGSARHIVRILDADQTHVVNTIMAIPNYRLQPTGDSRFAFWETPPGTARAMRAWFYPGDNFGQEFRFPKELRQIAVVRPPEPQLTTVAPPPEPAETPTLAPQPPAPPQAPLQAETTEPEVIAQNTPPPAAPEVATPPAAPVQELPKTATPYPLIGLSGLFSLGLYGLVRLRRSA